MLALWCGQCMSVLACLPETLHKQQHPTRAKTMPIPTSLCEVDQVSPKLLNIDSHFMLTPSGTSPSPPSDAQKRPPSCGLQGSRAGKQGWAGEGAGEPAGGGSQSLSPPPALPRKPTPGPYHTSLSVSALQMVPFDILYLLWACLLLTHALERYGNLVSVTGTKSCWWDSISFHNLDRATLSSLLPWNVKVTHRRLTAAYSLVARHTAALVTYCLLLGACGLLLRARCSWYIINPGHYPVCMVWLAECRDDFLVLASLPAVLLSPRDHICMKKLPASDTVTFNFLCLSALICAAEHKPALCGSWPNPAHSSLHQQCMHARLCSPHLKGSSSEGMESCRKPTAGQRPAALAEWPNSRRHPQHLPTRNSR